MFPQNRLSLQSLPGERTVLLVSLKLTSSDPTFRTDLKLSTTGTELFEQKGRGPPLKALAMVPLVVPQVGTLAGVMQGTLLRSDPIAIPMSPGVTDPKHPLNSPSTPWQLRPGISCTETPVDVPDGTIAPAFLLTQLF